MTKTTHSLLASFGYAFGGLYYNLKRERNMRIHFVIMLLVICAGLIFRVSRGEWLVLITFFALVPALECVNTALEQMCDVMRDQCGGKYESLGTPRDLAAGAVLWASLGAMAAGLIIFIPRLFALLS